MRNFSAAGEKRSELTREAGRVGETMASFGREYCVDIMEVVGICWVVMGSFLAGGGKSRTDCGEVAAPSFRRRTISAVAA